jgi:hypothetical protein
MKQTKIYVALSLVALAYSLLLSTPRGKQFTDDHTAETVVAGVGIVLLGLRFILPVDYWQQVLLGFGVAGAPLVGRSLIKRTIVDEE